MIESLLAADAALRDWIVQFNAPPVDAMMWFFSVDGEQFVAVTTGTQGGSPVQKPRTMLQEVNRPETGQAVYVFALPKQR